MLIFASQSGNSQSPQPDASTPLIQLNVSRILVPVVVRDRSGRIVDDLRLEDFQVFDNGKPHPVTGISVERRASDSESGSTAGASNAPGATAAAPQTATEPRRAQRFIVLLFDDLHFSTDNLAQAKNAAAKVLSETLVGRDIGAVISLSDKTNSGLTRDRGRLQDALNTLQSHSVFKTDARECPDIDYYQADQIENKHNSNAMQDAVRKVLNCEPSLDPKYQLNAAENEAGSTARRVLALGHQDAQTTYAAIAAFVRSLATLPGERIMILVSPGFLRLEQDSLNAESRLMNLAAESNVTISTLDARGLYATESTASEHSPGLSGPSVQQNMDFKRSAMTQAENPLAELADGTGGTFFHNNNDVGAGLKSLAEVPEVVYVLELSGDTGKADGEYHNLKVKVAREGVEVQARRGYFLPKLGKTKK